MSRIRCKFCNDVIESKHVHDFNTCKCGKVSIDGGNAYTKTSFPCGYAPEDCYEVVEK